MEDYKALYEEEKRRREELERKYDELVTRVEPMLRSFESIAGPLARIQEILRMAEADVEARAISVEPDPKVQLHGLPPTRREPTIPPRRS